MSSTSEIKKQNAANILRTIHKHSMISKNQVAEILNLSSVTVHNIITELTECGICMMSGDKRSRGGRNAALYKIDGDYGVILGQLLMRQSLTTVAYDMSLKPVYFDTVECSMKDPNACVAFMCEQVQKAVSVLGDRWNLLGLGVTLPGRSDGNGTVLHIDGYPAWKHMPLRALMDAGTGLMSRIDNDNNALALSSRWNGLSDRFANSVYLHIGAGTGLGILFGDELFTGSYGYGGEIGHTTIMRDGPLCECGKRGCVQAFLEDRALLKKLNQMRTEAGETSFANLHQAVEHIISHQDRPLMKVFEEAAPFFVILLEHVVRIFDPQVIILRCEWLASFPDMFSQIRNQLFTDCSWLRQDRMTVLLDTSEQNLYSSPACLFLEHFYKEGVYAAAKPTL